MDRHYISVYFLVLYDILNFASYTVFKKSECIDIYSMDILITILRVFFFLDETEEFSNVSSFSIKSRPAVFLCAILEIIL